MADRLFLLDGMALVYRAHFALISKPIFTSKGANTSAIYIFTQTLLDILNNQKPTHIGVAFDTEAPTQRHREFPDYKIQREAMPEDIVRALPNVRRILDAFNIPVISCDGYEADDLIGTLVKRAEKEGFECYMVTADKDFGQLVSDKVFLYKPSRMGDAVEVWGVDEVRKKWGIERPEQVIDILGLWGDTSDNIPGVPGIGEKTAGKLITQYGTVENLLAHAGDLKGKLKESLETHRDQALLSKRLATIQCDAPCPVSFEDLRLRDPNKEQLKALLVEFEFNSIGRRLFGDEFKAGRGFQSEAPGRDAKEATEATEEVLMLTADAEETPAERPAPVAANLKTLADVAHEYRIIESKAGRADLLKLLLAQSAVAFAIETSGTDPKAARLIGLSFAFEPHTAFYVPLLEKDAAGVIDEFRPFFEAGRIEKVGHDLKADFTRLKWLGVTARGQLFDPMVAHSLIEPDMRHSLDFLAEAHLGYSPVPLAKVAGEQTAGQLNLGAIQPQQLIDYACEKADLAWQLRDALAPLLKQKGQERVYYEIEAPLLSVLVDMEYEGVRIDANALGEFADLLSKRMADCESVIYRLAGTEFNLNSPKQLGEILFDVLKVAEKPKKTRTGQYATDEKTLISLTSDHEIIGRLLDYRMCAKLKSTYADTLPTAIFPKTGRVHTTFNQVMTTTGRLNSQDPNLQNIPIRTEQGREVRKAFVPRDEDYLLLSADYSQIELRIIAALGNETAMLEAFQQNIDIHTATAARVYGVGLDGVAADMRRNAKMVNYGIAYGISAFGLAQRLGIPRKEAAAIIEQYFRQFPGIKKYMTDTIAFCRQHGYVQTVTGRRRYLRDIRSTHATIRAAAERNAINMPIQGTAADMIKIAMSNIHRDLAARGLKTTMLLQVHDELVFDLYRPEEAEARAVIKENMQNAISLNVPIVVEIGVGQNWLEAH